MSRIDDALEALGPVALDTHLDERDVFWRQLRPGKSRLLGNCPGRTHVDPDDATKLSNRKCYVTNPIFEVAIFWLARRFQDFTVGGNSPAVIEALESVVLVAREHQRCAAMRT